MKKYQSRLHAHDLGVQALREGRYSHAMQVMIEGLELFGSHVGLLADLAGAAYLNGNMDAFQLLVERLQNEFQISYDVLSLESRLRTRISLAKYFEELGRLHEAFEQIDEALEGLKPGDPLSFSVRCQKLRLLASFGKEAETGVLYRQCLLISQKNPDAWIECSHALLIAEMRLFDFHSAWPRLELLMKNPEFLQAADTRLLLFDALEIAIEKGTSNDRNLVLEKIKSLDSQSFDPYEKILFQIGHGQSICQEEFLRLTKNISPMGALKLMALELFMNQQSALRNILREQLLFRLHSYDPRTSRYFQGKWGRLLVASDEITLQMDSSQKTLSRGQLHVSFKNSPQSWILLESLAQGENPNPISLLESLSRQANSEQDLETLRIGILRLEKKIKTSLHLDWIFRYGKNQIVVNPNLRFTR